MYLTTSHLLTDGVSSSAYQETAVNRDSLYTGRDPGGGTRTSGDGISNSYQGNGVVRKDGSKLIPNPPDRPATVRKGHQRQCSDPFVIEKDSNSSK